MFKTNNCKRRKILLIDVDSSIPNLVLMKISSHFKKLDFKVDLKKMGFSGYKTQKKVEHTIDASEYDKVFLSTIFTCNKGFIKINNCSQIYRGGTGFDYKIALPENIEHNFPDYSLYPKNKYSMGFLTRGCIRNCDFCVVPKKEGMLKHHANLEEFYHPGLPKVMLLDNNFLATRNCIELMNLLKETNKAITFKQGLDFRLLTKEKAEKLSELKYDGEYIFAFDNYKDKKIILKNMEIWKLFVNHWRTKFFVLVGFNSTLEEDFKRIRILKENKCLPYIMRHENCYSSPNKDLYTDLAAWCNQPGLFKKLTLKEFIGKRHSTKRRMKQTLDIIKQNKLNKYLKL
jgi:hypothetical protein